MVASVVIAAALLLQQPAADTGLSRREVRRRPVTPALEASAYRDSTARTLLRKARTARLETDRALVAYQARTRQRATMGLSLGENGPERVFYRQEQTGEVIWRRDGGASVRVTGLRAAAPGAEGLVRGGPPPSIPWFPGKEQLWIGTGGLVQAEVDERRTINPLAEGSEAYYTYATGDSTVLLLPPNERLVLRELRVRPRQPGWNVAVGSYWFDEASGQLVRATYRLTVPVNLSDRAQGAIRRGEAKIPRLFRMLAFPVTGQLTAITVEYGRYAERFWLPRVQVAEGVITANVATLPLVYEERFSYDAVEAEGVRASVAVAPAPRDTAVGRDLPVPPVWDSIRTLPPEARRALVAQYRAADSASRVAQCAAGPTYRQVIRRYGGAFSGEQVVPCDTAALARAFDAPMFPPDERPFAREATADLDRMLGLSAQPAFAPRALEWQWPSERGLVRFNRVEGLSLGAGVRQELGAGLSWQGAVRVGTGDAWPNAELGVARTNGRTTVRLEGYRRLWSLNDWGAPLSFGEALLALTAGRDEGQYARASGGAVTYATDGGWRREWRGFAERQAGAPLAPAGGTDGWRMLGWDPRRLGTAVPAVEGWFAGVATRHRGRLGGMLGATVDADIRVEAASGVSTYGRAAGELAVRRGIGAWQGLLAASGGHSVGELPAQREWWLGGARTVRGQPAATQVGSAFHLLQGEIGRQLGPIRPVVHADIGWAGARADRMRGRPMSGAGVGMSFVDGLMRVDVSRGLSPQRTGWRVDVVFDARF